MSFLSIAPLVNGIIWIFPGFTQRKERYNWFFITQSICTISTMLIFPTVIHLYSSAIVIGCCAFILSSFPEFRLRITTKAAITLFFFGIGSYLIHIHPFYPLFICILLLETSIFILFLKNYIQDHLATGRFNFFASLLMVYQLSIAVHVFYAAVKSRPGILYYAFNMLFEGACGFYFIFYGENGFLLPTRSSIDK